MNDRYLYRAKRTDNGEFIEGLLTIMWGQFHIIDPDDENTAYPIDQSTICQCTGLNDKNGKLIWENDIVQYCDCTVENYVIAWEPDKVCFEYQQYGCSIMNFDELSGMEAEVIGNIFDNPELLEVGE